MKMENAAIHTGQYLRGRTPHVQEHNMPRGGSGEKRPLPRVAIDSLAAAMLVTIMLDAWRLVAAKISGAGTPGLPWAQHGSSNAAQ